MYQYNSPPQSGQPQQMYQTQTPSPGGTFQGNRQYNDKIEPVANFGFAANNLFTIGLVRATPVAMNGGRDFKEKHFFFFSMVAGVGDRNSRTYNFQQKVSQKFALREAAAFAFVLKQCAVGNFGNVLPYRKFSNSQGMSKSTSIWIGDSQNQNQGRQIMLTVDGGTKLTNPLSPADAFAMAEIIESLFKEGLRLEIEIQKTSPRAGLAETHYNPQSFSQVQSGGFVQPGVSPTPAYNPVTNYAEIPQQQPIQTPTPPPPVQGQINGFANPVFNNQAPPTTSHANMPPVQQQQLNMANQFGQMIANIS